MPAASPPAFTPGNPAHSKFKTGATPSPRWLLAIAPAFRPVKAPLGQVAYVPKRLSLWGNGDWGDCVSAYQAFARACFDPEQFVSDDEVIRWAREHGVLNGAVIADVLEWMRSSKKDGFQQTPQQMLCGGDVYKAVNYSSLTDLQSALDRYTDNTPSPLCVGMASSALPNEAGGKQGWFRFGPGPSGPQDHNIGLSGYGTAGFLFDALKVPLPSGVDKDKPDCFLAYTWATIGVVDLAWIGGCTGEVWRQEPTTVGFPPLTPPPPPPPPGGFQASLSVTAPPDAVGQYPLGSGGLNPDQVAAVMQIQSLAAQLLGVSSRGGPGGRRTLPPAVCTPLRLMVEELCATGGHPLACAIASGLLSYLCPASGAEKPKP